MSLGRKIYLKSVKDKKKLKPGKFIEIDVDLILSNDITTPPAIDAFNQSQIGKIKSPEKAVIVADHFTPNKDIDSAEQVKKVRNFAQEWELKFFGAGCGIEHALLPEKGLVVPGDITIGADSHTVTYGALGAVASGVGSTDIAYAWVTDKVWFKVPEAIKVILKGKLQPHVSGKDIILYLISLIGIDGALYKGMEFCGETLEELSMESRFTISNMVIECGAKYGIMEPDDKTIKYVEKRAQRPYLPLPDKYSIKEDNDFDEVMEIDCSLIEPQVAFPSSPANSYPVSSIQKVEVDQVVLGSCTNGRWEDFVKASKIIKGRKAKEELRFIVIPSTAAIYKKMADEGLLSVFIDGGAIISPPTCGPCLGGHMGVLASGEKALSTTNRNFVGRMGHKDSEVYLANPEVAAETAVRGYISVPQ